MKAPQRNILQKLGFLTRLYFYYQRNYFRTLVEYRMDTWIAIGSGILVLLSSLVFLDATMHRIPQLMGWSYPQLLFLFGIAATGRGLNQVFFNAPFFFHGYIRRGMLDMMLVRPVGVLFQMIGTAQEFIGFGSALTGIAIILQAAPHLNVVWSFGNVAYLCLAIICSMLIQFAILMIVVIPGFWVLEMRSVIYPVAWLIDFSRYPMEIYHPLLRGLLTYVLPYALGSFYPAAYLLYPQQYGWALFAVPGTTIFLLWLTRRFWRFGLNHYSSAT
ncbi:MAG TPA: ABC-2 family transporter protein [Bacillota bacterium]|nr:ABC-2 family transporter protein [Bacillota bacterium]